MISFYEMFCLLEQPGQLASVERFPHDFEQVLNFMVGGPWGFIPGEFSPFVSIEKDKSDGLWAFFIRADYRGMSESGRHYNVAVRLNNKPEDPINGNGLEKMKRWNIEFTSYDPKGSPSVYFNIEEIKELGPDTDGRDRDQHMSDGEDSTADQRQITGLLGRLKKIQDEMDKDYPRPKWTPERRVYLMTSDTAKQFRLVDLARQVREEIAKYERATPNFRLH